MRAVSQRRRDKTEESAVLPVSRCVNTRRAPRNAPCVDDEHNAPARRYAVQRLRPPEHSKIEEMPLMRGAGRVLPDAPPRHHATATALIRAMPATANAPPASTRPPTPPPTTAAVQTASPATKRPDIQRRRHPPPDYLSSAALNRHTARIRAIIAR
ncbi:hypothetical protein AVEN_264064-1 [Araneus ventricosus]|uniref:Uncharacterized protein n=1 Tax=Araneus ventricosus TaxID=182803 RepID=A0A4Y2A2H6_ARAVE|nr:hypothetical protein AVEN_264064-1 [Araneus ventricosus]